jgi:peptidoglycan hydrolase CwlO-like protein
MGGGDVLPGGLPRIWAILCAVALVCTYARAAGAESTVRSQHAPEEESPAGSRRAAVREARVEDQDAALRERMEQITAVGDALERAQARADDARVRVGELGQQTRQLEKQIAEQDRFFRASREEYRGKARAAYKGESLEGLLAVPGG